MADVDGLALGQAFDFMLLPARATDFAYDQNVQAAYATYSFSAGKS